MHFIPLNPWMSYRETLWRIVYNTYKKIYYRKECKLWWSYYEKAIKEIKKK